MALWQKALPKATHELPLSAVRQNMDCGEEHYDWCQGYVPGSREHRKANSYGVSNRSSQGSRVAEWALFVAGPEVGEDDRTCDCRIRAPQ